MCYKESFSKQQHNGSFTFTLTLEFKLNWRAIIVVYLKNYK